MSETLLHAVALVSACCGMAWLALAMEVHWKQVRGGDAASPATIVLLRGLGSAALLAALWCCLRADHASMAALVWVMALAAAATFTAFTLSWWPRALRPLVAWIR